MPTIILRATTGLGPPRHVVTAGVVTPEARHDRAHDGTKGGARLLVLAPLKGSAGTAGGGYRQGCSRDGWRNGAHNKVKHGHCCRARHASGSSARRDLRGAETPLASANDDQGGDCPATNRDSSQRRRQHPMNLK
jgi:hypothetical protein